MNATKVLKWLGLTVGALVIVFGVVAGYQLFAFGRAADKVYDFPPENIVASTDSAVIARGRHIAESIGGCLGCHGPDLGGLVIEDLGPIGIMQSPNITTGQGGLGATYTDGELARTIRHGVRKDGRSMFFMPTEEHIWWPDNDLIAVVSFVRSMPPVDGAKPGATVGPLGKMLNQFGVMKLLSAASVDHNVSRADVPAPEPTARYGAYLARQCAGCHGENFAGGPIPGAPASLPKPSNLTRHETGIGGWTKEQFITAINTGVRPDGRKLDPFMPIEATRNMNDVEQTALWEYLQSLAPRAYGDR